MGCQQDPRDRVVTRIRMISHKDCVLTLYSDSALDRETTFCFLLSYEIKFHPIKTQYPDVDLLSSLDPAQSTFGTKKLNSGMSMLLIQYFTSIGFFQVA